MREILMISIVVYILSYLYLLQLGRPDQEVAPTSFTNERREKKKIYKN